MGSTISKWWWGGDPDEPDPISNLSRRDIYQIRRTWAPVYDKSGDFGIALFLRLFRADIEIKGFFKAIKTMNEEQISKSFQFRAHAINLMTALNMAIINLDQTEVVVAMMEKLGNSHRRLEVPQRHFETFQNVLMDFLANDLKLTPAVLDSYSRFMSFIYRHILEKLNAE